MGVRRWPDYVISVHFVGRLKGLCLYEGPLVDDERVRFF